jgi:hypothetical protein
VDDFIKDNKRWQERALTPEKRDSEALLRSPLALPKASADRILAALRVGKQSPLFERVKAVLDQLMT